MDNNFQIQINIPADEDGMVGRECFSCKKYFKLKNGTGLPTEYCHCPYCDFSGNQEEFTTSTQKEYALQVAGQQAMEQIAAQLGDVFSNLARSTRNNKNVRFEYKKGSRAVSPPQYHDMEDVETWVVCDGCGLHFAVYGVFARCPDCTDLNALTIYNSIISNAKKQLVFLQTESVPEEIKLNILNGLYGQCVGAFDALGKELKKEKPDLYKKQVRNLFQKLYVLDKDVLNGLIEKKHTNFKNLLLGFQVRHILQHNVGVVDEDFVQKIPVKKDLLGKKYPMDIEELESFVDGMLELGCIIAGYHNSQTNDDE